MGVGWIELAEVRVPLTRKERLFCVISIIININSN
jgi:hypothetical protein